MSILDNNGVPPSAKLYIAAKGVHSVSVFALLAKNDADFKTYMIDPFVNGVTIQGIDYKCFEDPNIVEAYMTAAWEECQHSRKEQAVQQQLALQNTLSTSPGPQQMSLPTTQQQQQTITSTRTPKELSPGTWAAQIKKYEDVTLDNVKRIFPSQLLIGAEEVLARMLHERTVTTCYTPVKLGEIISNRSLRKDGKVNEYAVTKQDRVLGITARGEDLTFKREPDFDPKSQWQLLDGIEATMFAMIFCEWGSEPSIRKWCEHFNGLLRKHAHNLGAVKEAWDTMSWKLALDMRNGITFDLSTDNMLKDISLWLEFFMTSPSPRKRTFSAHNEGKGQPPKTKTKTPKGASKGAGSGKGSSVSKWSQPFNAWQQATPAPAKETAPCRDFQLGRCTRGANCMYDHSCTTCLKKGHGSQECRSQNNSKGSGKGQTKGNKGKKP